MRLRSRALVGFLLITLITGGTLSAQVGQTGIEEVIEEAESLTRAERKRNFRTIDPDSSTFEATPEFELAPPEQGVDDAKRGKASLLSEQAQKYDITQALPLKQHCEYAASYAENDDLNQEVVVKAALCKGYMIGFIQATNTESLFGKRLYCLPDYLTFDKMISIYVKWLNDHPRWQNLSSSQAVMRMLQSIYPCHRR